ncbi:MAG: UvrD-helicase domain-containing protein [Polyangiales bacterium]
MAGLNPSQQAAVDHRQGPLLILAGAGSGKTRVLTQRIAALLREGVRPEAILAVSFTNKAADEMRERMRALVGKQQSEALVLSTFHSFGVRFVNEEKAALGLGKRFVIFDQGDSLGVVKDILRHMRESGAARKLDPSAILSRISKWKNDGLLPDAVPESDFEYDDVARDVYPEYLARLHAMRALDFDDLVLAPVRLLRENEAVRTKWKNRFRFVLVDEFQDTSTVQLELVRLLVNELGNVCVVGDDDQSIYGWRGAQVGNILDFDKHFIGTRVIKLEDNYRSFHPILAVANAAIAQSTERRLGKVLRAARGQGDRVRMCVSSDATAEAKLVAGEIADLAKEGKPFDDMAVLYRSNLQARLIEEELRARAIPYQLYGGTQFFDRKEVKDAAGYLRAVVNPSDDISLRRIINYPVRGVGPKTVERLDAHAQERGCSFVQAMAAAHSIEGIPEHAQRSIMQLLTLLKESSQALERGTSLVQIARRIFDSIDLRGDLTAAADGGPQAAARYKNVEFLLSWLERYEQGGASGNQRSLQNFLERVTLRGDPDDKEESHGVVLSTLHASKGLEFAVVFLIGCVEGQLPHSRTTDPKVTEAVPADVEEERRLFYVGVTRARDRLYITRPKARIFRGEAQKLAPSRFLNDLPEDVIEEYERPEEAALEFNEVAALGRDFLARLSAKSPDRA